MNHLMLARGMVRLRHVRGSFTIGQTATRSVQVTQDLIDRFAALSGDAAPLHVDIECARARGFTACVAHGALLSALASSIIGTELPGASGILHELGLSFHRPCIAGDTVTVAVTVTDVHDALRLVAGEIEIKNCEGQLVARGRFRSGLMDEP